MRGYQSGAMLARMQDITDTFTDAGLDTLTDNLTDGRSDAAGRFAHALRGLDKPKTFPAARPFRSITNDEKKHRQLLVEQCVRLGLSAEQIADFLPTWGLSLSRSQVYAYLADMRLPRRYCRAEGEQSHHDYYTFRFFIRIAQDVAKAGYHTHRLLKGKLAYEDVRFRPDFKFEVGHYVRFMELQLSDLTETRWSVKFSNYYRLRQKTGLRFRALFVIDQQGDLAYVRRFAREFLKRRGVPDLNLFLFIPLADLKGSANLAVDPVWLTPKGEKVGMIEWLTQPGRKPSMQRQ